MKLLAITAIAALIASPAMAAPAEVIGLPGAVKGDAVLCMSNQPGAACYKTPIPRRAMVIARDGSSVVVNVGGYTLVTSASNVIVTYRGCDLSLASYVAKSYCPK